MISLKSHPLQDLSSTRHAAVMHMVCTRIAAQRRREANTLPPPEDWQAPKPGLIRRAVEWFARQVTGIPTPPELGEAYRDENNNRHPDPL